MRRSALLTNSCRVLVKLLKDSTDPIVLAVAAHDVGQYVKYYERGKK
jgi:V-type H+-transporting ATPase subunit H